MNGGGAIMYGGPPDFGQFPKPYKVRPTEQGTGTLPAVARIPLIPCTVCSRHIVEGTECPFCFAAMASKGAVTVAAEFVKLPDRATSEALGDMLFAAMKVFGAGHQWCRDPLPAERQPEPDVWYPNRLRAHLRSKMRSYYGAQPHMATIDNAIAFFVELLPKEIR